MYEYKTVREELILFFLTEFSDDTPISYVEDLAKEFLLRKYRPEWVDIFWESQGDYLISELVEEFNRRMQDGFPINFTFVDEESKKVQGWTNPVILFKTTNFQKALLSLTDKEFERLAARIIQVVGCKDAWSTPVSHDQGLDAFGCLSLFDLPKISRETVDNGKLKIWVLVQAKHYNKEKVCSSDIREFVGSGDLAKHKIYATEALKYEILELKPFAPLAFIMITSGEVKRTAKLLADSAGIKIITSSDICAIFSSQWQDCGIAIPELEDELVCLLKEEAAKVNLTN